MQANLKGFQLSRQQQFLWTLQPEDATLVAQCSVLIEGDLDAAMLRAALRALVARHQILRTGFVRRPGLKTPMQIVGAPGEPGWREVDLTDRIAHRQKTAVEQAFQEEECAPFDLEPGPCLRAALLHLAEDRRLLILTVPALCADNGSLRTLTAEIGDLYAALSTGSAPSEVEDAAVQYAHFSEWQRAQFEGEDAEEGRAYWAEQRASWVASPWLPFERSRQPHFPTEVVTTRIEQAVAGRIAQIVERSETSIATFLLACWQTLLWRFSGEEAVSVGHVYDGRVIDVLEDAPGLFAQSLPVTARFKDPERRFEELLWEVEGEVQAHDLWQDAFAWSEHADADAAITIGFEFGEWLAPRQVNGASFTFQQQKCVVHPAKLHLVCTPKLGGIVADFCFDPACLRRHDVERIARSFVALVNAAAEAPDTGMGRLPILANRDWQWLVVECNRTDTTYPQDATIQSLFEAQAARVPAWTAVVAGEQSLTYAELNRQANRLAHHLRRLGVGPNVVVGLCLERSLPMVMGMLAVLKAGGAYVPLNPEHPTARLAHQLTETAAPVVLTLAEHRNALPDFAGSVLCLDADGEAWANEAETNPSPAATTDNLVYVIYTSGSTGTPKGVAVTQRNLVNYSSFMMQRLRLREDEGWHFGLISTFSADLGNTSLFPALLGGGCLHVLDPEVATDGSRLAAYVDRHPLDVLKIVPSHLSALLAGATDGKTILPRRALILGGEAFPFALHDRLRELAPGSCQIFNHYGPTETTVGCLTANVADLAHRPRLSSTVPIGRPIANTQVYVLDERGQPVPVGVVGELYIGGHGVSRGYLNQPERTAERFVDNPFSDDPATSRLYRTGDRVRWLPDGLLEFLGRVDNQVKIRGYRIELEEIEAVLVQHRQVTQAAVLVREDQPGQPQLVAYVVGRDGVDLSVLRDDLRDHLPDYMVPAHIVAMDKLPITANGKLDRKALPAPATVQRASGDIQSPRTPTEDLLAGIWAQVLQLPRVGVHDNFFALGGHSLLAMRVAARIREAFTVDLPLRALFEAPTLAQMAAAVDSAAGTKDKAALPAIEPAPRQDALPLSFAQQRLWFLDQLAPNSAFYNIPVAVRLRGVLNVDALSRAIAEIVRRHEILRTVYQTVDGEPVQVITEEIPAALPVVDLSHLPIEEREAEAQKLAEAEARRPFDLAQGPLFRVVLVRLDEREHVLVSTLHHIVSDIWSRSILIREVATLYAAFAAGEPSPLPELPVQYADFAHWQRRWFQGEAIEQQIAYWTEKLAGAPPLLELPTDHPRPPIQSYRGADRARPLSPELSQAVIDLCRREGVTPFMALLAAFQTLLFRYTGQDDIVVGSPITGRTQPETQEMMGVFLNTLIFRTRFDGGDRPLSFRRLLRQVRQAALEAYAYQDAPFEQLVEVLRPVRDMSHAPLFQVSFVMMNASSETLTLPDLTLAPFRAEDNTARHDLTLFLVEGADGFTANVEYRTDLFEAATIERMLDHFVTLLSAAVADPEQPVAALPMLPAAEETLLLETWNDTATAYTGPQTLHRRFEAQVEATPERIAVTCADAHLTYRELNQRANRLAHHLRILGVGPDVLVGLYLERSLEMMVSILGVVKAGGAYVPLDPSYPAERLAYMLADSAAPVILTQRALADRLPTHNADVVLVDGDWQDEAALPSTNPDDAADDANLAYVIYTSGSTGRPKGVMVPHRAIINHMLWLADHFGLHADDCYLQKTPFSFDASGTEFYAPLLTGGRLVMARPGGHQESGYLVEMVRTHGVTVLQLVPSLLRVLLDEADFRRCDSLRRVICAGEALPAELQQRFYAQLPEAELHNFYGPTEAAIDVSVWPERHAADKAIVPIGRPIANTQLYVLDAQMQPTPVGVPGQLYIGGANLARGYLRRPDLSAERFVPHPFAADPGGRLYQTGDLARVLPNGAIEFLGRVDHQVKLRGVRIELGEVEAALRRHDHVREAVALVREPAPGHQQLVAYVVTADDTDLSADDLRGHLRGLLPAVMVPGALVLLDRLPLTPNGKVDRHALPAPEAILLGDAGFVPPRNDVEERLAEIVVQLLRLDKVGVHDNFFVLGGHSLLATQFISRLRTAFNVELPLRVLFEKPTIAQIAAEIGSHTRTSAPEIKRVERSNRRVMRNV